VDRAERLVAPGAEEGEQLLVGAQAEERSSEGQPGDPGRCVKS
jgi:hypothetical protein